MMTISLLPVKTIATTSPNRNEVAAKLLYPNILVFENKESIHLVNLLHKNEDKTISDQQFKFDEEIEDQVLLENFLWLLFKSGEIAVINSKNSSLIKIVNESYTSFKIQQLRRISNKIYFISKSGDYFETAEDYYELTKKLMNAANKVSVSFKKAYVPTDFYNSNSTIINGTTINIGAGVIEITCPITGLTDIISVDTSMKFITSWKEFVVIGDGCENMYVIDLQDAHIIFEFEKNGASYCAIEEYNDLLYYVKWTKEEIQIFSASVASLPHIQNSDANLQDFNETLVSQETLKAQLKTLTDSLISASNIVSVSPQMQSLFETIDDYMCLIDTVTRLCQHNALYKPLLYQLQKRVLKTCDTHLSFLVSDLLFKIDLLEYIQFTGNCNYETINVFTLNYIELCVTFITKSDFDLASICWLKYSQLNQIVASDDIVLILNSISNSTKMGAILIWLKNFVPFLLESNPYNMDLFVRWTSERVFMLEQSAYWPKIGLKFIEEIITILETSLKSISIRPISVDDLDLLKTKIYRIMELKDKFKINILLSELSSQSPNEVALIMLRRCYTEDLKYFLRDYLPSYVTRHSFDLDDTLNAYIETEAASSGGGIDGNRLEILLEAFHSYSSKLECLLQVLKVLDVPWNLTVLDIAVRTVTVTLKTFTVSDPERHHAQEIQKEINYANVKVILKKYNFPLGFTDYVIVLNKIIKASVIELEDVKTIMSVLPTYSHYGNALYLQRCLEDCETKTALDYFYTLSLYEKKILLKTLLAKYDQIINRTTKNETLERNYIDFLKGTQLLAKIEIDNMENLYYFKNSYNISLNLNNINNENECKEVVNIWLTEDGCKISSGRGANVIELTNIYHSNYTALSALLRRTSTSHQVRNFVESLIQFSSSDDFNSKDINSILSPFKDDQSSHLLLNSYYVLIELIRNCKEENMHDLLKIISIVNSLIIASLTVKNLSIAWKFHYIFLPISSSSVSDLLSFFKVINSSAPKLDADLSLSPMKLDLTPFRLISNILTNNQYPGRTLNNNIAEVTRKIVTKIVTNQDLDELLLTALLLILRNFEEIDGEKISVLDVLKANNDVLLPHILVYISQQTMRRTFVFDEEFNKEFGNATSFPPQYVLKSKFNINLADVALPESSEETWDVKVILFYVLLQHPETTLNRLLELCNALNISINDGLSLQLISLLSTWELKYKVISDELGGRQIYLEREDNSLLNKCNLIWSSIEDKDFLRDILNDFWKNGEITLHGRAICINPYYYEVFLCIYRLIFGTYTEVRHAKEYFLLNFLKEYRRKSSPKQYEFELFSVKGMFPEIGYFRLPFHLFTREDMWSNLKSEITLDTYERWLPSVSLLSLDSDLQTARDMICSNAVKQTMTTRKRSDELESDKKQTDPWSLTSREEPLLRSAHRCVRHIANMEWAGACLFYVLQGCARGADQVAAAQLCYHFAQRWAALQPGNRAVRQMERLHATLSTRHALYKIDWACEDLLRLSTEPAQLIRTLYLHPDFVRKMSQHDVNRAANEIADKNVINISSIRIQLLESILDKMNDEKSKNTAVLNIRELMTAKYILKATCPKMGAIYLSRIAFDDESDHNKSKKLRALQCLMSVIDQDTAVKVANRERDALWSSLQETLSVVNLENIDMPWIAAIFVQDHFRALEQLMHAADGNLDALKVAAQLGQNFGSPKVLRDLIALLLRAALYEEMIPILLKLPSQVDSVICSAWRAVILSPFQRADYPITERQKAKCLNAVNLLPICPVIKDEDLVEVWKHCIRCKCLGLGCLVLPYMTSQIRQSLTELQKIDRRNLIASLKNMHADTYLVSGAMHVVEKMGRKGYR